MLNISPAVRIFVYALPTDMRKSFDGLYAIVKHVFAQDVFQGDYFVFLNRPRDRCKILYWDRDGLVVWAKRLEQGSFQLPGVADAAALTVEVDSTALAMILGGVDLQTGRRRKRYQAACAAEVSETIPGTISGRRSE